MKNELNNTQILYSYLRQHLNVLKYLLHSVNSTVPFPNTTHTLEFGPLSNNEDWCAARWGISSIFSNPFNVLIYWQLTPQSRIGKIVHNTRVAQDMPWPGYELEKLVGRLRETSFWKKPNLTFYKHIRTNHACAPDELNHIETFDLATFNCNGGILKCSV
jgi:hypothetical protein